MKTKMALSVLLLSAAFATPALANYFSNPYTHLNLNIGSAPSPTPGDVRENRLPQVVHAVPPYANVVAADAAKNADKPAMTDHALARAGEGKNLSEAQLSSQ